MQNMAKRKKEDSTMVWIQRKYQKQIKIRAAEKELLMVDLLSEIFEFYLKAHPKK